MKLGIFLIVVGAVLVGYSLTLQPFVDGDTLPGRGLTIEYGDSDAYYQLYDESLSPKYRLQDTGIMLILLSAIYMSLVMLGRGRIRTPRSKLVLAAFAVVLPFLSVAGYVFDLFQAMERQEYPSWADSLAIPLSGVPGLFVMLLVWSLFHLTLAKDVRSVPLSSAVTRELNPWIILVSAIAIFMLSTSLFFGQYWYAVPSVLWLYYYLSLGVSRLTAASTS